MQIEVADAQADANAFFDTPDLDHYINGAIFSFWSLFEPDAINCYLAVETQDIRPATTTFSLPSDWFVEQIVYRDGIPCRKAKYSDIVMMEANAFMKPSSDQPMYYIQASKIGVLPVPGSTISNGLRHHYIKNPPTLSDSEATIQLDGCWKGPIAKLAAGRGLLIKAGMIQGKEVINEAYRDFQVIKSGDIKEEEGGKKRKKYEPDRDN